MCKVSISTNRKINKRLLASFIEYAVENKVTDLENKRFLVNHYSDELMEIARRECSRYLSGYSGVDDAEAKEKLYKIVCKLRET
jgi:hypothetical protein